jgi:hypothetical protein
VTLRERVQRLVRLFIPAQYRDRAKAIIGAVGLVAQTINVVFPNDPYVAAVIAMVTALGVFEVPNEPVGTKKRKQRRWSRP